METVAMALSLPSQVQKHQACTARAPMVLLWRNQALNRLACMAQLFVLV
jgi:hypothetical protein